MIPAWMLATTLAALAADTVHEVFPPPPGASRVDGGAFGAWLGALPLRDADEPVRTFDGRTVGHPARVIDLPLVPGDLQQCADTVIRLRATWLRDHGRPVAFHATSGDVMPWARVQAGEVPYADGRGLAWRAGSASWERYLALVFTWAGTASLERHDTAPVADAPRPGDVLVRGGFPGHAVILLDVAVGGGQTWILIGEGYMPAQSAHVELGAEGGWWRWDGGVELGHWAFTREDLRRFL